MVSGALVGLDLREHGTEPLVGHDVALGDPTGVLEGPEGQAASLVANLDLPVAELVDATASASQLRDRGPDRGLHAAGRRRERLGPFLSPIDP